MQILTQEITGEVILHPLNNAVSKPGWTVREVASLPEGTGRLKWDDANGLKRVPLIARVPQEVTPRQFWLALLDIGVTQAMVETMLEGNEAALITVRKALSVSINDPLVKGMAAMMGKTDAEIDAIFTLAATK